MTCIRCEFSLINDQSRPRKIARTPPLFFVKKTRENSERRESDWRRFLRLLGSDMSVKGEWLSFFTLRFFHQNWIFGVSHTLDQCFLVPCRVSKKLFGYLWRFFNTHRVSKNSRILIDLWKKSILKLKKNIRSIRNKIFSAPAAG